MPKKKKPTAEQKVKRALAALDTAVQEWYKESAPGNLERYATVHIRDYHFEGRHMSNVTLKPCTAVDNYITLCSAKQKDGD